MNYIELIGYLASAFVLISFVMKEMKPLRIFNIVGCGFFVAYGVLLLSWPIIVTNSTIVCVHVFYLLKTAQKPAEIERIDEE